MGEQMRDNTKLKYKPSKIYSRIEDVNLEELKNQDIEGIFLDVDNTLFDASSIITEAVDEWLKKAISMGFKLCILSNTHSTKKVQLLRQRYNILGIPLASKPRQKGFNIARNLVDLPKDKLCIIGDQVFTDILGGNKFGIMTILVKPISNKEGIFTKIKRPFEKKVLNKLMEE